MAQQDNRNQDSNIAGITAFVIAAVLFVGGFLLMSLGFTEESPWIFAGGILACTLAFAAPMSVKTR